MHIDDAIPIDSDDTVPMEKLAAGTAEDPILLEEVMKNQAPGLIEAQFELDEETQQEVADAIRIYRLYHIDEPTDCAGVLQFLEALVLSGKVQVQNVLTQNGSNGYTARPIRQTQFTMTEDPNGYIGLIALERLWNQTAQEENVNTHDKMVDAILRQLSIIQKTNGEDLKRFGKEINVVHRIDSDASERIHDAWESDDRVEQQRDLQRLWNEWTALLTSEPETKPTT